MNLNESEMFKSRRHDHIRDLACIYRSFSGCCDVSGLARDGF